MFPLVNARSAPESETVELRTNEEPWRDPRQMTDQFSDRSRRGDLPGLSSRNTTDDLIADDSVFFLDDDDFQTIFQDDYYARLNLSPDASQEEIRNSYRQLSRLLHPDKHTESWKKSLAEDAFNRIGVAYEVLRDPYKRSLYDACGLSGVGGDFLQIVPADPKKMQSLEELREEREKRKEKASTNPRNEVSMGLDLTDMFEKSSRDVKDYGVYRYIPHVEITTMNTTQSIEAAWPKLDRLQMFSNVSYERGTGGGVLGVELSKTVAKDVTADCKIMTGPGRGPVAHLRLSRRLSPGRSISLSAFTAWSRFGVMPLFELSYGTALGSFGSGRVVVRGSSRIVNVSTRLDKDLKKGRLSLSTDASHDDVVFGVSYSHKLNWQYEPKLTVGVKMGFRGASLEYGLSRRVSKYNQLAATMALSLPGGVTLRITFQRSNQAFSFPILLSNDVLPAPVFYGTITPLVVYACVKSLYLLPRWKTYILERIQSRRNAYRSGLTERRKEFEDFVKLMEDKYEELIDSEGLSGGLVIENAVYGKLEDEQASSRSAEVQIQLQCLVRNHQLELSEGPKHDLPGFYDPAMGESKRLRIHYFFGGKRHLVEVDERDSLHLPSPGHLLMA